MCSCLVAVPVGFSTACIIVVQDLVESRLRCLYCFRIFDAARREETRNLFEYSFHEHSLRVTDLKTGYGGCNAIIVSASEDRTCKVVI